MVETCLSAGLGQRRQEVRPAEIPPGPAAKKPDMDARYLRNLPALSGEECALLGKKRILIVGCGGIGGHLLDMLLRIGVGHIRVCDGDTFEPSNLNRQLLSDMSRMGWNKARAAAVHGLQVNPQVTVEAVEAYMTDENVQDLIRSCDAVLDALDNVESRKCLAAACAQSGKPYIFGAVSGWIAQAAISLPGDGLIDLLYPEGALPQGSSALSFTPALCASMQAALCVRLLTGRPVETGKLYHFDLLNQEFETIAMI